MTPWPKPKRKELVWKDRAKSTGQVWKDMAKKHITLALNKAKPKMPAKEEIVQERRGKKYITLALNKAMPPKPKPKMPAKEKIDVDKLHERLQKFLSSCIDDGKIAKVRAKVRAKWLKAFPDKIVVVDA